MPIRVKICCIASIEEARLAVAEGAAALGLVSEMPSGPGVIDMATIQAVARATPPPVATVLLTSRTDPAGLVDQVRRSAANTVQLVDAVPDAAYAALRQAVPQVKIVQVIHVTSDQSVDEAVGLRRRVDALLLDSGNPDLPIKELGGTGRVHDWRLSRRIVTESGLPVFLAGGLNADNVGDAIRAVDPYGIDLCSGVRTDHRLDAAKLARFMAAASAA
jgi:phosphoribosylanthranilate isomerase